MRKDIEQIEAENNHMETVARNHQRLLDELHKLKVIVGLCFFDFIRAHCNTKTSM